MKKSFIAASLLVAATLFLSSCGGGAKSNAENTEEQTETTTSVADEVNKGAETVKDAVNTAKDVVDTAKEDVKVAGEEAKQVVTEAASKALAGYETLVNKVIPLAEKVKKGDLKAVADYTKQSKEIADYVSKNAKELTGLTGDDAKKYKELAESLVSAFKK